MGAIRNSATDGGGVDTGEPGLIARKGIRLLRVANGAETMLLETLSDPAGQGFCQSCDFFIIDSRKNLKLRLIFIVAGIDAIHDQRVDVQVEPQSGVEALDERDGATLRLADRAEFAGPPNEGIKDRLCENAKNIGHQICIVG